MTTERLFLDTSYAVALTNPADLHHAVATALSERIENELIPVVTTAAVVLEIGNSLSRIRFRPAARQLLQAIHSDSLIEILPVSQPLYEEGLRLFFDRPDKEWGLTDCISFLVMQERGIADALTADDHFRQAGFRPLLQSGS